jgi:hypothetical protein
MAIFFIIFSRAILTLRPPVFGSGKWVANARTNTRPRKFNWQMVESRGAAGKLNGEYHEGL